MRSKSIKETHDETERTKLLHSSIGKGFHSSAASNFDFPNNVSLNLQLKEDGVLHKC